MLFCYFTEQISFYSVAPLIPIRYQRLVMANKEAVGFSTQAKRFTTQLILVRNLSLTT